MGKQAPQKNAAEKPRKTGPTALFYSLGQRLASGRGRAAGVVFAP
jgi:hypothetical protein